MRLFLYLVIAAGTAFAYNARVTTDGCQFDRGFLIFSTIAISVAWPMALPMAAFDNTDDICPEDSRRALKGERDG